MALPDLDTMNAMALGMNPNDYKALKQKKDQMLLAQNTPAVSYLPDSVPTDTPVTQSDINAQTMSADQAPAQAPQQNLAMPPQDVSAPAPQPLTAPDFSGQQKGIEDLKAGLQKYLAQPQQVDLSPLAALADSQSGSKLAAAYKAPESPEDRAVMAEKLRNMIQQAQTGLSTEQSKYLTAKANQDIQREYHQGQLQARQDALAAGADKKAQDQQMKDDNNLQNDTNHFLKMANSYGGRQGELGAQQAVVDRAEHLNALFDAHPDFNLNKQLTQEVATGLDAMLKGGNSTAVATIHELVPATATGSIADIEQYITGLPQGRGQAEFMQQYKDLIDRQSKVAADILKKAKAPMAHALDRVKRYDEKYGTSYRQDLLDSTGVDENFVPQKTMPSTNPSKVTTGGGNLTPDEQKELDALKAARGG